jgi:hypothetical protein
MYLKMTEEEKGKSIDDTLIVANDEKTDTNLITSSSDTNFGRVEIFKMSSLVTDTLSISTINSITRSIASLHKVSSESISTSTSYGSTIMLYVSTSSTLTSHDIKIITNSISSLSKISKKTIIVTQLEHSRVLVSFSTKDYSTTLNIASSLTSIEVKSTVNSGLISIKSVTNVVSVYTSSSITVTATFVVSSSSTSQSQSHIDSTIESIASDHGMTVNDVTHPACNCPKGTGWSQKFKFCSKTSVTNCNDCPFTPYCGAVHKSKTKTVDSLITTIPTINTIPTIETTTTTTTVKKRKQSKSKRKNGRRRRRRKYNPCNCPPGTGWSKEWQRCDKKSVTSCDDCPTLSHCGNNGGGLGQLGDELIDENVELELYTM